MITFNFEKVKPQLKKYFVEYYGEKYREQIESRIEEIIPIFPYKIEDLTKYLEFYISIKRKELGIKYLKLNNIDISQNEIDEFYQSGSILHILERDGAGELIRLYFESDAYHEIPSFGFSAFYPGTEETDHIKRKKADFLKKMGAVFDDYEIFISSEEAKPYIEEIEKQIEIVLKLNEEFREYLKGYESFFKAIGDSANIKEKIEEKKLKEYVLDIKSYLSLEDQKLLDQRCEITELKAYKILIPSSIKNPSYIEFFSTVVTNKLDNPSTINATKEYIIEMQKRYFSSIGVYEEQMDFNVFMNSDLYQEYRPKSEFADELLKKRVNRLESVPQEVFEATSTLKNDIEKINGFNPVNKQILNYQALQKENYGRISLNYTIDETGVKSLKYLLFNCYSFFNPGYLDVFFIHEINHAIESQIIDDDGEYVDVKSGFMEFKEKLDCSELNQGIQRENFNEIINHMIAMEITKKMHEDGVYLFGHPKMARIENGTEYEHSRILVDKFFNKYKEIILKSRMGKSLQPIEEAFGRDNFNRLNEIVNEFSELPTTDLIASFLAKKETEHTRKKEELVAESQRLLEMAAVNVQK